MKTPMMTQDAWKYKNEWIALSIDFQKVLGHGKTTTEALDMATESGEQGFLFYIPEEWPAVLVL